MPTLAATPHRSLGARTGLEVAPVGLGLWAVPGSQWGPADADGTLEAIDVALDLGATFFDTADVYGGGASEEILGRAMRGRRDRFVVATKIGWIGFDGDAVRSAYDTTDKIVAAVDQALVRLQTDYLDVIQCHIFFDEPTTPVFLEGFRKLKEQGKVRAWGVSTGDLSRLRTFNQDGDCDVLQIDYSILNRDPEREILPYCREHGIGVIVRGPIAMGLLADKFDQSTTFPEDDFRRDWTTKPDQRAQFLEDLRTVDRLRRVVPAGQTMAQMAIRFVTDHPAVSVAIPGARDGAQATANLRAIDPGPLTDEQRRAIDEIVPPGGGRKIWPA